MDTMNPLDAGTILSPSGAGRPPPGQSGRDPPRTVQHCGGPAGRPAQPAASARPQATPEDQAHWKL